eukprot:5766460-Pleurochrysis_carterae.AAC.1
MRGTERRLQLAKGDGGDSERGIQTMKRDGRLQEGMKSPDRVDSGDWQEGRTAARQRNACASCEGIQRPPSARFTSTDATALTAMVSSRNSVWKSTSEAASSLSEASTSTFGPSAARQVASQRSVTPLERSADAMARQVVPKASVWLRQNRRVWAGIKGTS